MDIYDFKAITMSGDEVKLEKYKGKVLLIVNTASKCGFTPQFAGLQKLYDTYNEKGLEVLGFPSNEFLEQDPGSNEEIQSFCKINYGVSFPIFQKINVKGENANALFKYLSEEAPFKGFDLNTEEGRFMHSFLQKQFPESLENSEIKWNFTKFLIDRNGRVVNRYESPVTPEAIEKDIVQLL